MTTQLVKVTLKKDDELKRIGAESECPSILHSSKMIFDGAGELLIT